MVTKRNSMLLVLVKSFALSGCCYLGPDPDHACCSKSGDVLSFYDPTPSGTAYSVEAYNDAGLSADVLYHGESCRLLCRWPATTCYFGPLDCSENDRRYFPPPWSECTQRADGGAAPRFHPEHILVRCAPGILSCSSGRRANLHSANPFPHAHPISTLALLEHESITAFTEMASFLALHDAPASLLSRLAIAAEDESRHTAAMLRLAEHLEKSSPTLPTTIPTHPASLLDFALHNAREGCVRETYGAALAHYQSTHATDALVRETFATIAIEESQHAQLSWDVAAWVDSLLTDSERALVTDAITESSAELAHSLAAPPPGDWRDVLGLPSADVALTIYQQLRRALWNTTPPISPISDANN